MRRYIYNMNDMCSTLPSLDPIKNENELITRAYHTHVQIYADYPSGRYPSLNVLEKNYVHESCKLSSVQDDLGYASREIGRGDMQGHPLGSRSNDFPCSFLFSWTHMSRPLS